MQFIKMLENNIIICYNGKYSYSYSICKYCKILYLNLLNILLSNFFVMEDIIENFAKRLGIEPHVARQGISITCGIFFKIQSQS